MGIADWWDTYQDDIIGFGLDYYQNQQSNDTTDQQSQDIQAGFVQQNPWSVYQPAMGAGLMNLLQNPGQVTETPGYQFAYDQGLQGLFAKQAATGNRFSGSALTESMQFGQGLASQMWNTEINRYMQMAGATQGNYGGTGADQSAITDQTGTNNGAFLRSIFGTLTDYVNNTTGDAPVIPGTGDPNDPANIASP